MSISDLRKRDDLAALEAGLDALETHLEGRVPFGRRVLSAGWPPLLALSALVGLWQAVFALGLEPSYALPSPSDVFSTLVAQLSNGTLEGAAWTSLRRGAVGFTASVLIGSPLGLVVARVRPVRRAVGPLLAGLQSLPSVAWVPAAVVFFGFSEAAVYAVVLLGAIPSIANGMVSGIDQVPPLYTRVGRVLGATGLRSARHVLLPAALPGYVAGLRQGWAFSWRSLMAAELIAVSPDLGVGLGGLLDRGRQLSDLSLVFAGILAILLVGVAVEVGVFAPVERRVLRRRGLLPAS